MASSQRRSSEQEAGVLLPGASPQQRLPGQQVICIHVARKPLEGLSVAGNALLNSTGGLNIQDCRIALKHGEDLSTVGDGNKLDAQGNWGFKRVARDGQLGRWPANVLLAPAAAVQLDNQSGERPSTGFYTVSLELPETSSSFLGVPRKPQLRSKKGMYAGDTGGASRFFKTIHEDEPMTKVITLARKPSGMTVIQAAATFGVGGINIDGCRVASEKLVGWGGKPAGGMTWDESNCGLCKDGEARPQTGRWPANIILGHRPGCRNTDTVEDSQLSHNRWDDGAKPFGGGAGHAYHKVAQPPLSVDVWTCAPGCPVAALNEQSGYLHQSRVHNRGAHKPYSPLLDQGEPIERVCGYTDTGGAARFFKQVKP